MSLVVVRRFRDPWTAALARAHLDAAGIEAVLLDEHIVAQNWLYSNAVGGVRLCVDQGSADAARELLAGVDVTPTRPRSVLTKAAVFSLIVLAPLTLVLGAIALVIERRSRDGLRVDA